MYITWGKALSTIASFFVIAFVIFVIAVGIKAGVDGTSFIDAWNAIFGITAAPTPAPTPTPEDVTTAIKNI